MPLKISWYTIAIGMVLAGIIHIAAVFALPLVAPKNAWGRLSDIAPLNTLVVLPAATPSMQPMPMLAPDLRVAVCRFDLGEGPIKLSTEILDPNWILTFNSSSGDNFYTVQGADIRNNRLDVIIALEEHALLEATADRPDQESDVEVVRSPDAQGFATVSASVPGPSFAARAEAALKRATCARHIEAMPPEVAAPEPE